MRLFPPRHENRLFGSTRKGEPNGEPEVKPFIPRVATLSLAAVMGASLLAGTALADKPYEGMTLNLASQNDQFAAVLAAIAPSSRR